MPPRKRTITAKRETVTEEVTLTETAQGPLFPPGYAELRGPLQHYEFPVWPQAWWTASDAYRDELAAGYATDQALLDEWHAGAMEATLGPLDAWMAAPAPPDMMP